MNNNNDFTRAPGQAPRPEFQPQHDQTSRQTSPQRTAASKPHRRAQNRQFAMTTPVTYLFCAICLIVFCIDFFMPQYDIHARGLKNNDLILNGGEYYRLFTCTLLHASVIHILNNLIMFKAFGSICENRINSIKFTVLILGTALSASMSSLVFTSANSVGASGICFGMIGAAMSINGIQRFNPNLTRACWSAIIINVILGILNTNIDNAAHLGGLVGGWILGFGFGLYSNTVVDKILKILSFITYGALIYVLYGMTNGTIPNPHIDIPSFNIIPII